ncbi:MAG: stage V sporulation protein AD, partial [Oscillospiraceae bacterium]|nr:stage V sporulation protein AD [Oscillospiraceae bacterium]
MARKISRNTFIMENPPTIQSFASTVGSKEGEGPLADCFDEASEDAYFGQKTWEQG